MEEENLGMEFEYTTVNTAQQNRCVKQQLQTLCDRNRSVLIDASIKITIRNR